jgi:hypothetical protein
MWPIETIAAFDLFLRDRGLRFDGVVIGGAALSLLGVVSRPTKDVDILVPKIPKEIHGAARAFAVEIRATGEILHDDWLNNGPASLADHLSMGLARTSGRCFRRLRFASSLPWSTRFAVRQAFCSV